MSWKTMKLSECCVSITDGDHLPPPKSDKGIPFVTIANINATNQFNFTNTMYVPQEYYDKLDSKRKAQAGDILYSVVGSFGIPVYIKENKQFVFQRHIAILRPNEKIILPRFLYYTMLSKAFYAKADAAAIGAAQRTVSLTALRNIEIEIPSLKEQKKVVSILSTYDELIENNQKQIGYSKDINRSTGGTRKIGEFTNSFKKIMGYFESLYKETTNPTAPIRRITIGLNNLQDDYMASISLFDDIEAQEKEKKLREAVVDIKKKYGKNIILKGISYTEKATARSRNKMVGGHNGGD